MYISCINFAIAHLQKGPEENVGNPLSRACEHFFISGRLRAHSSIAQFVSPEHCLQYDCEARANCSEGQRALDAASPDDFVRELLRLHKVCSYWQNNLKRVQYVLI